MRHSNHNRKFGRMNDQRRAFLRSLAEALLEHGKITTTVARAKELRPFVEKLITKGRAATVASRRTTRSTLGTKARAASLAKKAATAQSERKGGYTRIVKIPKRLADGSPMAIIELL